MRSTGTLIGPASFLVSALSLTHAGGSSEELSAGAITWESSEAGETAIVPMKNAPFPHASRDEGFKGSDRAYPREPHYVDNSVALFVPKGYRPGDKIDLLVYFHGHLNNIKKAMAEFRLREQIAASGRNVILVFPEGPKDAADSGGGRLEEAGGLKRLIDEVLDTLATGKQIQNRNLGRVLLAGHSGAYRAISFCIEHGGLEQHITDVCLLDASYARLEAFVDWAARRTEGRLFSVFTNHLADENVMMMTQLRRRSIPYELLNDEDAADEILARSRILFLHTVRFDHNQTVQWLERWLRSRTGLDGDESTTRKQDAKPAAPAAPQNKAPDARD